MEDKELLELASRLAGENVSTNSLVRFFNLCEKIYICPYHSNFNWNSISFPNKKAIEALREHWRKSESNMVKLKELGDGIGKGG